MNNNDNRSAIWLRVLLEISVTGLLLLAMAVPRLLGLDRFITPDETLWLDRAGKFYYALNHHDLTVAVGHPGVTIMWAGFASYTLEYPQNIPGQKGLDHTLTLLAMKQRQFDLPLRLLITARRILILFNLLALVTSFLFAQQLFGKLPALVGFLLIAFDPFHIGLTKILHLDGTLANLMLLSVLAFLVYLERRSKIAFLVSAVATGLAWLTKSPGLFLIPFIILLTLLYQRKSESAEASRWRSISSDVKMLAGWTAIAVLVFWLLWPAMWVKPIDTLANVFKVAIGYAEEGHESSMFFNGQLYLSGKIADIRFYPINFLWRTTPITLLGLLAAPVMLIRKNSVPHSESGSRFRSQYSLTNSSMSDRNNISNMDSQKWAVIALLLFALGFGAFITIGLKKFDRYIIPSIVTLDLVAGVSLVWLAQWAGQFLRESWKTAVMGTLLLSLVAVQAVLAWKAFPYFFNYYNPLLGGTSQAVKVMQIGWGEGLDQAARYINEKPNSNRLRVMAWYGDGPFLFLSKSPYYSLNSEWKDVDREYFNKADYVVIYIHQLQRNIPVELLDRLRSLQPEYSIWIDGLEYVRVYKIQ